MSLLEVKDLRTRYTVTEDDEKRDLYAADGVSFSVEPGGVFGLVGESGCGKSTVAQSVMQLLPRNGKITDGKVEFDGRDLTQLSKNEIREVRWERIAMVSQSAMNAFDPVHTIGAQIREAIDVHREMPREEMDARASELFEVVGLEPERLSDYPHQFSGGMKQRAMIAMALVLEPDLIIADEPTTALDVISQDTILHYLETLQEETGAAILLITHDMSVVAELCDSIGVMYAGRIAEQGPANEIFEEPLHPYTMGLKNAFPRLKARQRNLISIPGSPPDLVGIESKCRFVDRCPFATTECHSITPPVESYRNDHEAACIRIDELGAETLRRQASDQQTWQETESAVSETNSNTGVNDQ